MDLFMTISILVISIFGFILKIIGAILSIIWYFKEKHRNKYAPVMFFIWCFLGIVYRIARWYYPLFLTENTQLIFRSFGDSLLLSATAMIVFLSVENISDGGKNGNIH
jgi:hypothetical protein